MRPVFSVLLCVSLFACGSEETDLESAFCDILANGPEVVMTAASTVGDAPDVAVEDTRVALQFPSGSTIARYVADEEGSFAFGLSDDIGFDVMDVYGNYIPFDAEVQGECAAMAVRYTVTLEADEYLLLFSPGDLPAVDLVSEESDDDL